jgi:hypothetical protein
MNKTEVNRWREFTNAMINNAWDITDNRKQKLLSDAMVFIDEYAELEVCGWDQSPSYPCDGMLETFSHYYASIWSKRAISYRDNKHFYIDKLSNALRAGLNAALGDSYGVIGFTVGDVKRFFDGNTPDWFACRFDECLDNADNETGIWL